MTLGSRSSPASAIAGSPGSSCCSPKISTDTKNSVGMIAARRLRRKLSIRLVELQALQPDHAVGHRAESGELVGVAPQPMAMVEVDDGPVLRLHRRDLLEELQARGGIHRGARLVDEIVHVGAAVARVVEGLLAREVAEEIAVGIRAPAPCEHERLELPLVGHVER